MEGHRLNIPVLELIFKLYLQMQDKPGCNPPEYTSKWEADIGVALTSGYWNAVLANTKSSVQNVTALEWSYKIMTRWNLIPARVSNYAPQIPRSVWLLRSRKSPTCIVNLPQDMFVLGGCFFGFSLLNYQPEDTM